MSISIQKMRSQIYILLLIIVANAEEHADYRLMGHWDVSIILFRAHVVQECKNLGFQKHKKPKAQPLKVIGELALRDIHEVDDIKMDISMEITLR